MKKRKVTKKVVAQVANQEIVEKKHEQIVGAASQLFSKKGYHPATMREISAASGLNLSYIYKYVSSKDDILYLFYQHLHKQWRDLFQFLDEEGDPIEQMKNLIISMLKVIHKFSGEILTMYTESRHLQRDSLYAVLTAESEMIKSLEKLITRGVNKGCFKTEDSFMTANIIHYLIAIEALRGWNFRRQYSFRRFVQLVTDFVFNALGVSEEDKT